MTLTAGMARALAKPIIATALVDSMAEGQGPVRPIVSPHDNRLKLGSVHEASEASVAKAMASAAAAQEDWDRLGGEARATILDRAADLYEANTELLMALLVREAGKSLDNAVADLREAVDFLRYYGARARADFTGPLALPGPTGERNELTLHGRGVFACIAPWNFPVAIFTGQVAAALAAGNSVVAKPAEQTPLVAHAAVKLLHQAGVPPQILHFLPGDGARIGKVLLAHPALAGVAFTGSNETAAVINRALAARDGAIPALIAETGGLNAMIVDFIRSPRTGGARCTGVGLRQCRPALLGGPHSVRPGRCGAPGYPHAEGRHGGTENGRSPRLCNRCRPGDRR